MALPLPGVSSPLLLAAAAVLLLFLVLYVTFAAFALVGFSPGEAIALLFIAPLVSWINIPILQRPGLVIAVNVAGVVIPTVLVLRFALQGRLRMGAAVAATAVVTVVAFFASEPTERGIQVRFLVVVFATAVATSVFTRAKPGVSGPVAFTAGTVGTLVGADILHLRALEDPARDPPLVGSIGGAGTLDAIYLVGLLAVLLEIVAVSVAYVAGRLSGGGVRR